MIVPFLRGILSFKDSPVTWILFFINLAIFIFTSGYSENHQTQVEDLLRDNTFSGIQGVVFAEYVQEHKYRYPSSIQSLADQVIYSPTKNQKIILGNMSMRDARFLSDVPNVSFVKDPIAANWWKVKFKTLLESRLMNPNYDLGVTDGVSGWSTLISYQFAHSGWSHLIGNMLFFLIFSSALELFIGGLGVLIIYLGTGVLAALSYLLLNDPSAVPLVGASGAISGVMAFLCVLFWGQNIRYFFFLFIPRRGYAGVIYLPAWITLILWFVSDLAGHLSTPTEFGGIAYSAHLGGEFFGALMALCLVSYRSWKGLPSLITLHEPENKAVFTHYV